MKTPPDDTTLALWLDDELEGEELAQVEAWATAHPEQLEAREQVRSWRKMIAQALPAAEEPPAAEFFNERIQHAIRTSSHSTSTADHAGTKPSRGKPRPWNTIWMPLAACAGMVLAFWLGAMQQPGQSTPQGANINGNGKGPHLYTPEQGVNAEWISNKDASATVIVLNGVSAIPDEVDFSSVALHRTWREIDSTAASESPTPEQ